jgi:hypothetical protein
MKMSKLTIIATGLILGFASTSYAANPDSNFASTSNQGVERYQALVSAETVLNYSEVLLMRSSVARKLKFSDDLTDQARFAKAKQIYREASKAYHAGNDAQAKKLALESIQVIARSVPRYYDRVAKANEQ